MPKIKRKYRSIYTRNHRSSAGIIKWILGIVAMLALVFVGYSIAGVIMKLATGQFKPTISSSQPSSSQTSNLSSSASMSSTSASSSKPNQAVASTVRGVFLPVSYLSDMSALNTFITQAKSVGINMVVIDLKSENGIVNYASKLPALQGTKIIAAGAPDASVAAKALSAAGITPAARICAFQDPVAPNIMRGAGVLYAGNHTLNWLDTLGNRWLNPYSTTAQQYICDLSTEAVSLGYKQIFVDSLTFPTQGNPDTTGYYGDNLPSKEQCISDFTAKLKQQVDAVGGKLSVIMPGAAAIGQAAPNLGQSQDVFSLSGDYISPNLCPSLFNVSGIQVGTTNIQKPDLTPGNTISTISQYLKTQEGTKLATALPIIQDYTNTALGSGNYKQYTPDDVKAEITALANAGMGNYILYSPSGNYDLSALK